MSSADRVRIIKDKLIEVLDDASGIDLRDHTFDETFLMLAWIHLFSLKLVCSLSGHLTSKSVFGP